MINVRALFSTVPMGDFSDEVKRSQWINEKGLEVFTLWDPAGDMPNVDIFAHYPISFNELWDTAEQMDLGGIICHVASIESLIKMKSIAGRKKDLEDIEHLKEGKYVNRGEEFAHFGLPVENGQWPPHLRKQTEP